jgi:lipid A 4'-phosphatase
VRLVLALIFIALVLAVPVLWPGIDIIASGFFYRPHEGFFLGDVVLLDDVHYIAYAGARLLGMAILIFMFGALIWRAPVFGIDAKTWLFLFLGLIIGPGLIANGVFKDNWGRARPREITEFGGDKKFTPALVPASECERNCSFVAGDGAFGFYLPSFAYAVPRPRSRRVFWAGIGLGSLFSFARLATGAHFLSDIVYAGVMMQAFLALLHGLMFGWERTGNYWTKWFSFLKKSGT